MENLGALQSTAEQAVCACNSFAELQTVKTRFLGPKSDLIGCLKALKNCEPTEKAQRGKALNAVKVALEAVIAEKIKFLQSRERLKTLGSPIDPTLPSPYPSAKPLHPLTQVRKRIAEIFKQLGYSVAEGAELETEWFCFDALNAPENHPSRSEQDTFFLPTKEVATTSRKANEKYLLRTQTSTVQIRTLLKHKPPLKIISPGRCFRRDTDDATHHFNFYQVEGLCIDKDTSVADLKGTLGYFVRQFFGKDFKVRLRPSFFPFTEPGFEVDIFITNLGKLHNTWLEVLGCGMVHPNVFKNCGIDDDWQGFAFGVGIERLAMLLYGIEDVRRFYQNDERFLAQF